MIKDWDCTCEAGFRGEVYHCPLHAAAPDMYEACKGLLEFIKSKYPEDFKAGGKGFTCPHHQAIEKALARAEANHD